MQNKSIKAYIEQKENQENNFNVSKTAGLNEKEKQQVVLNGIRKNRKIVNTTQIDDEMER